MQDIHHFPDAHGTPARGFQHLSQVLGKAAGLVIRHGKRRHLAAIKHAFLEAANGLLLAGWRISITNRER